MIFRCDNCGIRYSPERDVSYKHQHFCGMKCKEDFIDDLAKINGQLELPLEEEDLIYPWIGPRFDP